MKKEYRDGKSLEKVVFKTIDQLIECIDCNINTPKKLSRKLLCLNGNELDSYELIQHYKLEPDPNYEHYIRSFYSAFKSMCPLQKNRYSTGPASEYGHVITKFNINNILVEIAKIPKTKYEKKFCSNSVNSIDKGTPYIVLDIETTGLDFLTSDVIQIGVYENEANQYSRYLPLEKKQTNTAIDINHISDSKLKNKKPLQQEEIDALIERFDIKNKIVVIWTGANQFDRMFLELYFKEHNLTGLEHFTFFNAKTVLDSMKDKLQVHNFSKDEIANIYGIKSDNSHDALSDCKLEKQIVEKLLSGDINPLIDNTPVVLFYRDFKRLIKETKELSATSTYYAKECYEKFITILKNKHGMVWDDYDKPHARTRGKEWIDRHHIDEIELDDIATRTNLAIQEGNEKALEKLSKYNQKSRLVWATKVEHFILHILIDFIRFAPSQKPIIIVGPSGGPNWTFGDMLKLKIGIFEEETTEYALQSRMSDFYQFISFDELLQIYIKNAKLTSATDLADMQPFWKLDTYNYDKAEFDRICNEIEKGLTT